MRKIVNPSRLGQWFIAVLLLINLVLPTAASAHGDEIHAGEPIMSMWQFEPEIVIGLMIALALYTAGARRGAASKWWRHALFFAGLAALALALLSPIEPLADHIFAVHQVEHMLLRTIGPMLIVLSHPQAALMRAACPTAFAGGSSRRSLANRPFGGRSTSSLSQQLRPYCLSE